MNEVHQLIQDLADYGKRHQARKELELLGDTVAPAVLEMVEDESKLENMRWAGIQLLGHWNYQPAVPVLIGVLQNSSSLRSEVVRTLEAMSGEALGDDVQAWMQFYDLGNQGGIEICDRDSLVNEIALFERAIGANATTFEWKEEGYLYLRFEIEGGRKQQLVVSFSSTEEGCTALVYTECGTTDKVNVEQILAEKNRDLEYGECFSEQDDGKTKVVMQVPIALATTTEEKLREILFYLAVEADLLEYEITGEDRI